MIQQGSSPIIANGQSEKLEPLSAVERKVLNQLLNGHSISEVAATTGYSDILVASALRNIETKANTNNLVRATINLIVAGVLKI